MKSLIEEYETVQNETKEEQPYLETITLDRDLKYNPKYGDDKICKCGHTYDRHFDSYEQMEAVGCKYCRCNTFKEAKPEYLEYFKNINKRVQKKSKLQFKSTFKINRVFSVIEHPELKIPVYKFYEDDSYVDCRLCIVIPEIDN